MHARTRTHTHARAHTHTTRLQVRRLTMERDEAYGDLDSTQSSLAGKLVEVQSALDAALRENTEMREEHTAVLTDLRMAHSTEVWKHLWVGNRRLCWLPFFVFFLYIFMSSVQQIHTSRSRSFGNTLWRSNGRRWQSTRTNSRLEPPLKRPAAVRLRASTVGFAIPFPSSCRCRQCLTALFPSPFSS